MNNFIGTNSTSFCLLVRVEGRTRSSCAKGLLTVANDDVGCGTDVTICANQQLDAIKYVVNK